MIEARSVVLKALSYLIDIVPDISDFEYKSSEIPIYLQIIDLTKSNYSKLDLKIENNYIVFYMWRPEFHEGERIEDLDYYPVERMALWSIKEPALILSVSLLRDKRIRRKVYSYKTNPTTKEEEISLSSVNIPKTELPHSDLKISLFTFPKGITGTPPIETGTSLNFYIHLPPKMEKPYPAWYAKKKNAFDEFMTTIQRYAEQFGDSWFISSPKGETE